MRQSRTLLVRKCLVEKERDRERERDRDRDRDRDRQREWFISCEEVKIMRSRLW